MTKVAQRRAVLFCLGLLLLLLMNMARSVEANPTSNFVEEDTARSSMNNFFNEMRYVYQIYKECSEEGVDVSPCLKLRLLSVMDRVSRSTQLDVADGVTFLKEGSVAGQEEVPKSLQEIEANLPRALNDKEEALNSMIFDRIVKFVQSYTLKLKLSNVEELHRSFSEEGRNQDM